MGYSRKALNAVKELYTEKRIHEQTVSDQHREELYRKIPSLRAIDDELASTGPKIMACLLGRSSDSSKEEMLSKIGSLKNENQELLGRRKELLKANGYPPDYSDIQYECSICRDYGYTDDGKMCSCMKKALVDAEYEISGLAGLINRQSFDNFSLNYYTGLDRKKAEANLASLKEFASDFRKYHSQSWFLMGKTGLGKTHLSTAVAKAVIDAGYDVAYTTAISFFNDCSRSYFGTPEDKKDDLTAKYYKCDLLIIDDLGTEMTNQFTLSALYDIINSRISTNHSTIINTNLDINELRKRYDDRITSRLLGEYKPLLLSGRDIREQKLR